MRPFLLSLVRRASALLQWLWHQAVTWGLFTIVLLAVYVGLGRQFVPSIGAWQSELESWLSARAGVTVRFGSLRGEWHGLTPVIIADRLYLRSPLNDHVLLAVPEARLVPDVAASLWNLEPRVRLAVSGLRLNLEQQGEGGWLVKEFAQLPEGDAASARQMLELVLRQPQLQLDGALLSVWPQEQQPLRLTQLDALLTADGQHHGFQGSVKVSRGGRELPLRISLLLDGDPLQWQQADMDAYLQLPETELTDWWQPAGLPLAVRQARVAGEVWLTLQKGVLQEIVAKPHGLSVQADHMGRTHSLSGAGALLQWLRAGNGWNLTVHRPRGTLDGVSIQGGGAMLSYAGGAPSRWRLIVPRISLKPGSSLARQWLEDGSPYREWLNQLSPEGQLKDMDIRWRQGDGIEFESLRADFDRLGVRPVQSFPGFSGLSGSLMASANESLVRLDASNFALDYPQQFREKLVAEHLGGVLHWRRNVDGWVLASNRLNLTTADARGRAALRVSAPVGGEAHMTLSAALDRGRADAAWKYVPWPSAGQDTLDWLKTALRAGRVEKGWFFYDGGLGASGDGRLQMHFALDEASLDYGKDWPVLKGLKADVDIDPGRIRISNASGMLNATRLQGAVADITFPDAGPQLDIRGDLHGPGSDVIRLFRESPLRSYLGSAAEDWSLGGDISASLSLGIPLQGGDPSVNVQAVLKHNDFDLKGEGLRFAGLEGGVSFSSTTGLSASQLQGQLLGRPVLARIQSQVRKGDLQRVQVGLRGKVPVSALATWAPSPLWRHLQGEASYQADVQIQTAGDARSSLQLTSDLSGVRCTLPAPLGKSPAESLPLRYSTTLGGSEQFARLAYAKRFGAALVWREGTISRGGLRFGSEEVSWPQESGISIDGRMQRLLLDEWQKIVAPSATSGSAGASTLPPLTSIDLEARELIALGSQVRNARLRLGKQSGQWQLGIRSDRVSGTARWSEAGLSANAPLVLDLDSLKWPLQSVEMAGGSKVLPAMPRMDVQIDALDLPGVPSSSIRFRHFPETTQSRIEDFQWTLPGLKASGRADWALGRQTHYQGVLDSDDLGKVFTMLGLAPTIAAKSARIEADLNWPGDPWDLRPELLDGKASVRVQSGRLLAVSNAASATRVVGLFNFANLGRRFKLDFSDLTQKGVAFDEIVGNTHIRKGVMDISRYELKGPALNAQGNGRVNLGTHSLDMQLAVTVPVTRVLPLAAAVVAGPIIGGAVLAAQAVLNRPLEKITTLHYRVGGSWDEPDVKLLTPAMRRDEASASDQKGVKP